MSALHAEALDTQIRILRLRRAVLRAVAKRGTDVEGMDLVNKLARLSAEERDRILADYHDEVLGGLDIDPEFERRMRSVRADLPADPTPDQVEAWIELAELVQEPGFRGRVRQMAEAHAALRQSGQDVGAESGDGVASVVLEKAGASVAGGIDPASPEGAAVLVAIVDAVRGGRPDTPELRATTAERFATGRNAARPSAADLRPHRLKSVRRRVDTASDIPCRVDWRADRWGEGRDPG